LACRGVEGREGDGGGDDAEDDAGAGESEGGFAFFAIDEVDVERGHCGDDGGIFDGRRAGGRRGKLGLRAVEEADQELNGGAGGEGDGPAGGGNLDAVEADDLGIEGHYFGVGL